jgi:hypothetical protein
VGENRAAPLPDPDRQPSPGLGGRQCDLHRPARGQLRPQQPGRHEDLTVASGDISLPGDYRPTSHVLADTQHVFYTSNAAEMIELWWQA